MRSSDLISFLFALYDTYTKGERSMLDAVLIGKSLQEIRKSKGLSQEVLSGLADLDRTHYSKIERGLRIPTLDTLFKIAHALNMPPHELVELIEKADADKE